MAWRPLVHGRRGWVGRGAARPVPGCCLCCHGCSACYFSPPIRCSRRSEEIRRVLAPTDTSARQWGGPSRTVAPGVSGSSRLVAQAIPRLAATLRLGARLGPSGANSVDGPTAGGDPCPRGAQHAPGRLSPRYGQRSTRVRSQQGAAARFSTRHHRRQPCLSGRPAIRGAIGHRSPDGG